MGIQIAVEFRTECDGKDAVHIRGIPIFMIDVPVFVVAPEMVVKQKKVLSISYTFKLSNGISTKIAPFKFSHRPIFVPRLDITNDAIMT